MSPPKLTADTPVPDIVRPVKVGLFHTLRYQLHLAVFHSLRRRLYQLIHFDKPLLLYQRFDGGAAAVVGTYIMGVLFYFYQEPHLIQLFYNGSSRRIALHPCKASAVFIDSRIIVHHIDNRQIVALAHFKIVGVMCRRNLYHTGSKFHIHISVVDNGHLPVHNREHHLSAD